MTAEMFWTRPELCAIVCGPDGRTLLQPLVAQAFDLRMTLNQQPLLEIEDLMDKDILTINGARYQFQLPGQTLEVREAITRVR